MAKTKNSYEKLIKHRKKTALLSSCAGVLAWDREVYMPSAAAPHRAEQLSLISGMLHERETDPRIGEWLADCQDNELVNDPLSCEAVNVREIHRSYEKKIKIPKCLVEELTRTTSLGHQAWIESRQKSDFNLFCEWLERIIGLKSEYASILGSNNHGYDALLDDYDPGESTKNIMDIFRNLRRELVPLLQRVADAQKRSEPTILKRKCPLNEQRIFGEKAAGSIGFDFNCGRLDTVVHPFCTHLGPKDTRITTRWDENNFSSAFFGILHETGHGLYDQGLPSEHWGTPVGSSVSLGIHESQSRLWENIIGRSQHFWNHFYTKFQAIFHRQFDGISLGQFVRAINHVRPSFIRVEADEATYNLHIILRSEIEQALISGDLKCKDLPQAWNEKFKLLFDLEVPDDANGCLQDVHWSFGSIGYFPTYTLGNLYAAQFYQQAKKDITDLTNEIERGNFSPLLTWLRTKIHHHGMRFHAKDLVKKITGEPLNPKYFITYLTNKYSELYDI